MAVGELTQYIAALEFVRKLERRGHVTTNPHEAGTCCGMERDDDGFCRHRDWHPIYVDLGDSDE